MTHPLNYLLVCVGWWAASHEQEDHLQSWPAAVAPSPGRQKGLLYIHKQQRQRKNNVNRQFLHCECSVHSSPSHSTLWESCDRGISWRPTKKAALSLLRWHFRFQTLKKTEPAEAATVPPLTSWCCRRSAWGTWPCKADLDQHLSFSLSFLRIDCAWNMATNTPHEITHI